MEKQPEYSFCTKQFKPALIAIVVTSLAVVAWTTYGEMFHRRHHRGFRHFIRTAGRLSASGQHSIRPRDQL